MLFNFVKTFTQSIHIFVTNIKKEKKIIFSLSLKILKAPNEKQILANLMRIRFQRWLAPKCINHAPKVKRPIHHVQKNHVSKKWFKIEKAERCFRIILLLMSACVRSAFEWVRVRGEVACPFPFYTLMQCIYEDWISNEYECCSQAIYLFDWFIWFIIENTFLSKKEIYFLCP